MGSYLSIVNDMQHTWMCSTSQEGKPDDMNAIVTNAVAAISKVIIGVTAVSLAADGNITVHNVPASALVPVSPGAAIADAHANLGGTPSNFSVTVAQLLSNHFTNDGFEAIAPGQTHRWGKFSLNLYRESRCVKWVLVDEKTVFFDALIKRPMYSGSTTGSDSKYAMYAWFRQYGTKSFYVDALERQRLLREGADETHAEELPSTNKVFHFDANGTKTIGN